MQIRTQFALEEVSEALGILDSFTAQDLTKDPSSMANVALHFAYLVPEGQAGSQVIYSHFSVVDQTILKSIRS